MTRKEEYQNYLRSAKWQELRRQALEAAQGKCQVCNSGLNLQVHHREYPKVFGTEALSFLTVLCEKCHKLFHNIKKKPAKKKKKIGKNHARGQRRKLRKRGIIIQTPKPNPPEFIPKIVKRTKDGDIVVVDSENEGKAA